ncbi:hypothetical protein AgCh_015472 [Apium graveolens]
MLIVSNELILISVEGRHLKSKECKKCSRQYPHRHHHHRGTSNNSLNPKQKPGMPNTDHPSQENDSKMDFIDDFRPTSPGHSPGIGHSVHN